MSGTRPFRRTHRVFAVLGVATMATAIGACGGDDKPAASSKAVPTEAPPKVAPPTANPDDDLPTEPSSTPEARPAPLPVDPGPPPSASVARTSAERDGKPLLAIVVPKDGEARQRRAHILQRMIDDLAPWRLASLASAVGACLSPSDVEALAPNSTTGTLPFAVVIETSDGASSFSRIEWPAALDGSDAFPSLDVAFVDDSEVRSDVDKAFLGVVRGLEDAIDRDAAMRQSRAKQSRLVVGSAVADRVEAAVRAGKPLDDDLLLSSDDLLLLAAPVALALADAPTVEGREIRSRVGRTLRPHLRSRAFPGAAWTVAKPSASGALPPANWCGTGRYKSDPGGTLPLPPDALSALEKQRWLDLIDGTAKRRDRVRKPSIAPDDDRPRAAQTPLFTLVFLDPH